MARVGGIGLWFLGWLCLFGLFAHGYVENTDAEVTMHAARAWYLRGDPGLLRTGEAADVSVAEDFIARQIHEPGGLELGMPGRGGKAYVWFPIGHQALMLPCAALGDVLARWFPAAEARGRELEGEAYGALFWTRFLVSWLPIPFLAGSLCAVLLLARALGAGAGEAIAVALVAILCTQAWPGGSETLSDVPGGFFLLAAVLAAVRYRNGLLDGAPRPRLLLAFGLLAGAAVLVRYPHALPVAVLTVALAVTAVRARRAGDLGWLVAGGGGPLLLLLAANQLRFGTPFETGYSTGATATWFSYQPWFGIPLILLAPGKGALWFSLPLWLGLASLVRHRREQRWVAVVALACLLLPVIVSGHTAGWAGGQCWSVRYVTPQVVLCVATGLTLGGWWRRRRRGLLAVAALAVLVSLGGVLSPYRGDRELAHAAAAAAYPATAPDLLPVIYDFEPRFSPIHSHWTYAWLSASGRLAEGGSRNTTEPMFGVRVPGERGDHLRPSRPQDIGFRHWWFVYGASLFGWPWWPALLLAAAGVALVVAGGRRLLRS